MHEATKASFSSITAAPYTAFKSVLCRKISINAIFDTVRIRSSIFTGNHPTASAIPTSQISWTNCKTIHRSQTNDLWDLLAGMQVLKRDRCAAMATKVTVSVKALSLVRRKHSLEVSISLLSAELRRRFRLVFNFPVNLGYFLGFHGLAFCKPAFLLLHANSWPLNSNRARHR